MQRRFEGAGIGLSIVQGLVGLQHGHMVIDSELGKGTTVTITLPLDMAAANTDDADQQSPKDTSLAKTDATTMTLKTNKVA